MELSKKYIVLVAAVLMVVLTACSSTKQISKETVVSDSTRIEVITTYRDSILYTTADTVITKVKVICDSNLVPSILTSNDRGAINAQLKMEIHEGWLIGTAFCNELELKVKMKDQTIKELRERKEVTTETKIIKERFVPQWIKFFAWSGGVAWLLLLLFVFKKFFI